ncbi:MAG: KH domain-containing protein [Bacilli bacterium]|nr:KH domain-containing protein [Bacilli bacterium]
MKEINYEKLVSDLVYPLVLHPEDMVVKTFSEEDNVITIQIIVNADDVGRIIGKKGRVINSVRTIAYACAARHGKRIEVSVDSF